MRAMQMGMMQRKLPEELTASPTENGAHRNPGRGHERSAVALMFGGLGLTIAATAVLYIDHATGNVLARHIRSGYPSYSKERIDTAVTTYLIWLSSVGALGIVGWLWAVWTVKARKPWARVAATVTFAIGTGVALFDLLVKDTSGATGLPPLLGWVGMAPCLAGLLATTMLWRSP